MERRCAFAFVLMGLASVLTACGSDDAKPAFPGSADAGEEPGSGGSGGDPTGAGGAAGNGAGGSAGGPTGNDGGAGGAAGANGGAGGAEIGGAGGADAGGAGGVGGVDTTPPAVPTLVDFDVPSPSNENAPTLRGTADAGESVLVFSNGTCAGSPVATVTAAGDGSFSATLSVGDDTVTTLSAWSRDEAANTSACAAPLLYIEDSQAPTPPTLSGSTPASPANDTSPTFIGTAEAGTTVSLFYSADCSTSVIAAGVPDGSGSFSFDVTVSANTTTTVTTRTADAAGNVSPCSAPLAYTDDGQAPTPPSLGPTSPASPANDNAPTLPGTSEASATISLFASADCSGSALDTTTADGSGGFSFALAVTDDSSTTYSATAADAAGNVSGCSTAVTYVEDSFVATPTLTGLSPSSPANDNAPSLLGTAEAGATVSVYATATCGGSVVATGAATGGGTFDIPLSVGDDTTTALSVVATDVAGNVSACSGSLVYVEDSDPPLAPSAVGVSPTSPANDNAPTVTGIAEADAALSLFASSDCSGSAIASTTVQTNGTFSVPLSVGDDTVTTLSAQATDAAGNDSPCSGSITYTEDSQAPAPATWAPISPTSPANDNAPTLSGTAESGALVTLYVSNDCSGAALDTTTSSGSFSFSVSVGDDTTTDYTVTLADAAGNTSGCSAVGTYVEDSQPPAAALLASTLPVSPIDDNAPSIVGTAEAGAAILLYEDAACSGAISAAGSVDGAGDFAIPVSVPDNTMTTFWAVVVDGAGNASSCSTSSVRYVEQSASTIPSVAGTISYAGSETGRIYIGLSGCQGCGFELVYGTSIETPGPYLIRGVSGSGGVDFRAWMDKRDGQAFVVTADPSSTTVATLTGANVSGADLTLTDATPAMPPAPADPTALGGPDTVIVLWDPVRDSSDDEIADGYDVFLATSPAPGPSNNVQSRTVRAGVEALTFFGLSPGTYYAAVRARNAGFVGALSPDATATVGPSGSGVTVSGTVTYPGYAPAGTLFVIAVDDVGGTGAWIQRIPSPAVDQQDFAITGVPDGQLELFAMLDVNGDGLFDQLDVATRGVNVPVVVSGAPVNIGAMPLPTDPATATITTRHYFDGVQSSYDGLLRVESNGRMVVTAALRSGGGLTGPVDLALARNGVRHETNSPFSVAPTVGADYTLDVTFADGSAGTATATVTGVVTDLPVPVSPVGAAASTTPTFSWSAPASLPAAPFTYVIYLYRPALTDIWWVRLDSSTTSVLYDFDGTSIESPLLGATPYVWMLSIDDAYGNYAYLHSAFTTP